MTIRLVVVEDLAVIRSALVKLFGSEDGFEVVAGCATAAEGLETVAHNATDVVLLDTQIPDADVLEVTQSLRERSPRSLVVLLTNHDQPNLQRNARNVGASGVLRKDAGVDTVVVAVRTVAEGGEYFDLEGSTGESHEYSTDNPLTAREAEVLVLAGQGYGSRMIASRLGIGEGAARNQLSIAISKLGHTNRFDAARAASQQGWLPEEG